jgi:ribosomal protein S18 acetylase RimI-like enzyme
MPAAARVATKASAPRDFGMAEMYHQHVAFMIRTAHESECDAADGVARRSFAEYEREYPDWIPVLGAGRPMSKIAEEGELLVAESGGAIVGCVGYIPPGRSRNPVFEKDWAALRFMAVDPTHRGHGISRALADECVRRAKRDGAKALALFTSPAMKIAIAMYKRMGFEFRREIAPVYGMAAELYVLTVSTR